jgi:hypothetical protein
LNQDFFAGVALTGSPGPAPRAGSATVTRCTCGGTLRIRAAWDSALTVTVALLRTFQADARRVALGFDVAEELVVLDLSRRENEGAG